LKLADRADYSGGKRTFQALRATYRVNWVPNTHCDLRIDHKRLCVSGNFEDGEIPFFVVTHERANDEFVTNSNPLGETAGSSLNDVEIGRDQTRADIEAAPLRNGLAELVRQD